MRRHPGLPPAGPEGPLVVACLRVTDLRQRVDPLTGAVSGDAWGIGLAPADAAALEHALRMAGAWDARLVAVAAGPPAVEPVLRSAQALGAVAVRVPLDDGDGDGGEPGGGELAPDEHRLARRLVAALEPFGPPSLVVCGDRSADRGTGAVPAFLAHELGAAQALGLVRLELPTDPPAGGGTVLAERRLDGGWRERLVVPLPAVCSVEPAGVVLRRASLPGALTAAEAPVTVAATGAGDDGRPEAGHRFEVGPTQPFRPRTRLVPAPAGDDPRARLLALTGALVERDPPTVIGPVDAGAAADAVLGFLVRHGYLETTLPAGEAGR